MRDHLAFPATGQQFAPGHVKLDPMRRPALLLASAVLLACGGPGQTPTTKGPKGAHTKQYAPLEMKADAKAKNQAVILGTDTRGGSTVIPLVEGEGSVKLDTMLVKVGDGAITGDTAPVTLTTGPNVDGEVRVGIYEQLAGGAGAQWRAGVWLSSFIAATTLGKDLTDFKFSAESGGSVDGASASGLMTAGFLAALTGAEIDRKATMTGIINPDGTIGPVAGIPQKFIASIDKGKTRLGYPIGMRYSEDLLTGKRVDLVELAKSKGATAVEIGDVYDAYHLMTGKTLPRPVPVDEADMQVDDAVAKLLEAKYDEWQKQLAEEWARILELDAAGRLPASLAQLALAARQEATTAEKLHHQGLAAPAYNRIATAWLFAASATSVADVLDQVRDGNLEGAVAKLVEFEASMTTTETTLRTIGGLKPDSMGGHLQVLSAFQKALVGWGFHGFAQERTLAAKLFLMQLATLPAAKLHSPAVADEVVANVAPAVLAIGRGIAGSTMALQALEIEQESSVNYLCSLPNVKRLSESFRSAASANLAYFEALFVKPAAQSVGISDDQARVRYATAEPDYLVAYMAAHLNEMAGLPDALKKEWGEESMAWRLASLAASELSFFRSSLLIGKHYSLGVQNDPISGISLSVEHDKAFMHMLTSAERKARENARAAKIATGAIPIQARITYQNARVLREGDLDDKLRALEGFWASSVYSQTAQMLARN
jgi:uncharacterized protein